MIFYNKRIKNLINSVKIYSLSEIFAKGLNWLLLILLPLIIDVESYGVIGLIIAFELLLNPMFKGGQPITLLRLYDRFKTSEAIFLQTIFRSWIHWLIYILPIALLITFLFQNQLIYYLIIIILPLEAINEITVFYLRAKQEKREYFRIRVGFQFFKFVFVILFSFIGFNEYCYPLGVLLAIVLNLINIIFYFKKHIPKLFRAQTNKMLQKISFFFSIPILFQNISAGLLLYLNRFMIKYFIDDAAVGIFSFLFSLSFSLFFIVMIGSIIFQPFIYRFKRNEKKSEFYLKTYTNLIFLIIFIFSIFLFYSFDFLDIFYSKEYLQNKSLFIVLLLTALIRPFYNQGNFRILLNNKPVLLPISTGIAAFINFMLNLYYIPKFGIEGAAISYFIANAILVFIVNFLSLPVKYFFSNQISSIIILVLSILVLVLIYYDLNYIYIAILPLVFLAIVELFNNRKLIKNFINN